MPRPFRVVIDEYPPNETDFNTVFATKPQAIRDLIFQEVISPMVDAEIRNDGHFVHVLILGHADRQDDVISFPTPEARRASELEASFKRLISARDFIFTEVQNAIQVAGDSTDKPR
jgi:hypothetical protein